MTNHFMDWSSVLGKGGAIKWRGGGGTSEVLALQKGKGWGCTKGFGVVLA